MHKKILLSLMFVLILFSLPVNLFADESITLTTYYPSPYGSYNQLKVASQLDVITSNNACNGLNISASNQGCTASNWLNIKATNSSKLSGGKYDFDSWYNGSINNWLPIVFSMQGTEIMRIDTPTGNVGIGTTSPAGKLSVTNMTDQYAVDIYASSNSYSAVRIRNGGGSSYGLIADAGSDGSTESYPLWAGPFSQSYPAFYVRADGLGYLKASSWLYGSDRRLKENIKYIPSGLNIINQLKPVSFDYINGDKKQVGFIAQEVKEILPDTVTENPDGMLGLKTDSIIPYLVKAIQEQQNEIEFLKQEVAKLKD